MESINWHVLLTANFWFSKDPGPMLPLLAKFLLVFFALCLGLAVMLWLIARIKRKDKLTVKLIKKFQNFSLSLGIIGFLILFLFFEQIPYLSSRFWLIIWLIIALVWLGFIGKFGFLELPKRKEEQDQIKRFKKYLPQRKK